MHCLAGGIHDSMSGRASRTSRIGSHNLCDS